MVNLLKIYIKLSIFSIFVMINIVSSFAQINPSGEIMSEVERRYQTQQDVPTLANEMIQYSNQKYNANNDPIEKSFYSEIKKHFNNIKSETDYPRFRTSVSNKLQQITNEIINKVPDYDQLIGGECATQEDCKGNQEKCIDIAPYDFSKSGKNGTSCSSDTNCMSGYCHPKQKLCTSKKRCLSPIPLDSACDPFWAEKSYCGSNAKCMDPNKYLQDPLGVNWFISFAGAARIIQENNSRKVEISSCMANGGKCSNNIECCSSKCYDGHCKCAKLDENDVCLDNKACIEAGKSPPNNDFTLCCDQYMENSLCKKRCYSAGQKPSSGNAIDCCSGLIDSTKLICKAVYKCLNCTELKQSPSSGGQCCKGLTLFNGKCEFSEIIPLTPRYSFTEKIIKAISTFVKSIFFSSAQAAEPISNESCNIKTTPILTTQNEIFFNALAFISENNSSIIEDYWGINKDLKGIANAFKKIRAELIKQGEEAKKVFKKKCLQLSQSQGDSDQILFYDYLIEFHESLKKIRKDSLIKYKDLENKNSKYIKDNSLTGNSLKELYERTLEYYNPVLDYSAKYHSKYISDTFLATFYKDNPDLWWKFVPWIESKRSETTGCKVTWNSFWFDYYGSDQTWNYYYLPHAAKDNKDIQLFEPLFNLLRYKDRFYTMKKKHNCGFLGVGRKIETKLDKYYLGKNPVCNESIPNSFCIKEVYEIDGLGSKDGLFMIDPIIPSIANISKPSSYGTYSSMAASLVIKESYVPEFANHDTSFNDCNLDPFSINKHDKRPVNPVDVTFNEDNNPPFASKSCNKNNYNTSYNAQRTIPINKSVFVKLHEEAQKYALSNAVQLFHPEAKNTKDHLESFANYVIHMHFLYPRITASVQYPTPGLYSYIKFAYEIVRSINISKIDQDTIVRGLNVRLGQLNEVRTLVSKNNDLVTGAENKDKTLDPTTKAEIKDVINPMDIISGDFSISKVDEGLLLGPSDSDDSLNTEGGKKLSSDDGDRLSSKKASVDFLSTGTKAEPDFAGRIPGKSLDEWKSDFKNNPRTAQLLEQQKLVNSMLSGEAFFSDTSGAPKFTVPYRRSAIKKSQDKKARKSSKGSSVKSSAQNNIKSFIPFQRGKSSTNKLSKSIADQNKSSRRKIKNIIEAPPKEQYFDTLFKKISRAYYKIALPRLFKDSIKTNKKKKTKGQ